MSELLVWPIILPMAGGAAAILFRNNSGRSHILSLGSAGLLLIVAGMLLFEVHRYGILAIQVGNWPAPYGITLVADRLSAAMVMVTAVINLAVTAYSRVDIGPELIRRGHYCLLSILVAGISGAFLTGDVFNLYVWFEVMLMASFGLLVLGQSKSQLDGGVKYVTINLFATLLFITAIGLLYGLTGTLNMADLNGKIPQVANQGLLTALAVLFIAAFGIKAAIFPLFFWLPAAYHTPPVSVSAIFSGLLTKVGVYALIRFFTLIFDGNAWYLNDLLAGIAALTMITGVLGAAAQMDFRRILSFHIISQVGYMVLGLALHSRLALAGTLFYLVHHIIVKANLFLVSGIVRQLRGSFQLAQIGGLYRSNGWIAALFFIPAFSLAGFPPLSGFWAKMVLIRASLEIQRYELAVIAAVVGLLTVYSMTKIWTEAFWKPAPEAISASGPQPVQNSSAWMVAPVAALSILTIVIGLGAEVVMQFAIRAAADLGDPSQYVKAVMEGRP